MTARHDQCQEKQEKDPATDATSLFPTATRAISFYLATKVFRCNAIDGFTPLYQVEKYQSATSPIRLASGLQGQYIIAEIQGGTEAVAIINEVRARQGVDVTYAPNDPSDDEVRRKVLEERSRTLFLEGQRMGDLRRYAGRYGIDLFPTGENFGDQTCFPLPDAERDNNPDLS